MLRIVLIFIALLWADNSEARFPRGEAIEAAVTTCNMNTGACTGQDAGTGLFTAAICDGVTNTLPAFNSFNTWALSSSTQTQGKLIELRVTGTCFASGGNARPFKGLTKARLWAYGTSFTGTNSMPGLGVADTIPGICHKSITDAAGCSARINSVSAGASSITLNATASGVSLATLCARFTVGKWAIVSGLNIQSTYGNTQGYPPNWQFFDYVQITSKTNCTSTGQVDFSPALTDSYLSTWPLQSAGSSGEADQGGPASIYALDQYWGGEVDLYGFALTDAANQSIYQGRKVTLTDVTMAGAACIIPSQNGSFTMNNSTGTGCDVEVDKQIGTLTYNNIAMSALTHQSSSTKLLTVNGATLTAGLNGTPRVAVISNLTNGSNFKIGPISYGVGLSASCTNCASTGTLATTGNIAKTSNNPGIGANINFPVSSGVFSSADFATITGFADNGSGLVRLTMASTVGWPTGAYTPTLGVFVSACPGGVNGCAFVITNIDATHIDLVGSSFAGSTWTGSGSVLSSIECNWCVPGTNLFPIGVSGVEAPAFQVTGVTQSANATLIATTLPGGYPNVPLSSGKSDMIIQQPKWTCTNCTGSAQFVDFGGAPPNTPAFSYSNRTFSCAGGLPCSTTVSGGFSPTSVYPVWGTAVTMKYNVTAAYAGATNPLRMQIPIRGAAGATDQFYGPLINLRQLGLRTITPAGITCDTGGGPIPGGCTGDTIIALPVPYFFGNNANPSFPNGQPTDGLWSMNVEFVMDQGVVP